MALATMKWYLLLLLLYNSLCLIGAQSSDTDSGVVCLMESSAGLCDNREDNTTLNLCQYGFSFETNIYRELEIEGGKRNITRVRTWGIGTACKGTNTDAGTDPHWEATELMFTDATATSNICMFLSINGQYVEGTCGFEGDGFINECYCTAQNSPTPIISDVYLTYDQQVAAFDLYEHENNQVGLFFSSDYYQPADGYTYTGRWGMIMYAIQLTYSAACGNLVIEGSEQCDSEEGCGDDCRILPGYSCDSLGTTCTLCASNEYGIGGECVECVVNSVGSTDRSTCECIDNFYMNYWGECMPVHGDGVVVGTEQCDSQAGIRNIDTMDDMDWTGNTQKH